MPSSSMRASVRMSSLRPGSLRLPRARLTLEAMTGMLGELLPDDARRALDEFGAVQHDLPGLQHFRQASVYESLRRAAATISGSRSAAIANLMHTSRSLTVTAPDPEPEPELRPPLCCRFREAHTWRPDRIVWPQSMAYGKASIVCCASPPRAAHLTLVPDVAGASIDSRRRRDQRD